jgi:hypothetical protein
MERSLDPEHRALPTIEARRSRWPKTSQSSGSITSGSSAKSRSRAGLLQGAWVCCGAPRRGRHVAIIRNEPGVAISRRRCHCRGRIVRAPARAATPLRPCGDPRPREAAAPHMKEDIPLPLGLPAAALKYAPCRVSRLQAVNDRFQSLGVTFRVSTPRWRAPDPQNDKPAPVRLLLHDEHGQRHRGPARSGFI